jgi:hypothetical protein
VVELVREHHLREHARPRRRPAHDPQPLRARVVVAGDALGERRGADAAQGHVGLDQPEQLEHLLVGAALLARVGAVEVGQAFVARLRRSHGDGRRQAVEPQPADLLDALRDHGDRGDRRGPGHRRGPLRRRRRQRPQAVQRDRQHGHGHQRRSHRHGL